MTPATASRAPRDDEQTPAPDRAAPPPADTASGASAVISMPVDIRSAALTVLAVIAVVLLLQVAQSVLIPIVIGVLISYALDPIVTRMAKLRVPRPLAAALLIVVLTGGIGWLLYGLRDQAVAMIDELPHVARRVRERIEND